MKPQFIKSATKLHECPEHKAIEIALVGRSNAGKSALINALAKQKNLARVSQKPGKTEWLNFYQLEENLMLVDTPGYGYAAKGAEMRKSWTPMISSYLEKRKELKGVILVMDAIRNWSDDEGHLVDWMNQCGRPVLLILTKIDRLNQSERASAEKEFATIEGLKGYIFVSAHKGTGIDKVLRTVFEKLLRS